MSFLGNIAKLVVGLVMVVAVVAAGVFIFQFSQRIFAGGGSSSSSTAAPVDSGKAVLFTIKPGDSVNTIIDNLKQTGVIGSDWLTEQGFRFKLKQTGAEKSLKAGRYQLSTGMDQDRLLSILTSGVSTGVKFQVIEGERLEEIAEKLGAQGLVSPTKFLQLAGTPEGAATFQDDFLAHSGRPGDRGLEGYLFPDTYVIDAVDGDNSELVIRTMLQGMEAKFTPEMHQAIADSGHTIHQVLTIASIVQREGKVPDELPIIASVFWNRVKEGMRLDADPTTQYAVAGPGDWWPNLDKRGILPSTVDHPYNTYRIPGLPPGPICGPGAGAINGAVYPADTAYLYFVAKNDGTGSHAFAETLDEQERNRVEYGNK